MSSQQHSRFPSRIFMILALLFFAAFIILISSLHGTFSHSSQNVTSLNTNTATTATAPATPSTDPLITPASPVGAPPVAQNDPQLGPHDAPVTIIEFSDFDCPYCKDVQAVLQQVIDVYGKKVRIVWKDFPLVELHPNTLPAHIAARCAQIQNAFFPYKNELYTNQDARALSDFSHMAKTVGLDMTQFTQCINAPDKQIAIIENTLKEGLRYGVDSTPYFFINDRELVGAPSFDTMKKMIDAELR